MAAFRCVLRCACARTGVLKPNDKAVALADLGPALTGMPSSRPSEGSRSTSDHTHQLKMAVRNFAEHHQQLQLLAS